MVAPDAHADASVSDWLRDARRAHEMSRRHRRDGRSDDHRHWVREAQRLRLLADDLDPAHADQAWQVDAQAGFHHAELLAFYVKELAKDPSTERAAARARVTRTPAALEALKTHHAEALEIAKTGEKMRNAQRAVSTTAPPTDAPATQHSAGDY